MKSRNVVTAVLLMLVIGASAQSRVDKRQAKQKQRIVHGVNSGELTAKETKQLAKQQKYIYKLERRAKKDGVITPKEKARIELEQDKANKLIARKKNNLASRN